MFTSVGSSTWKSFMEHWFQSSGGIYCLSLQLLQQKTGLLILDSQQPYHLSTVKYFMYGKKCSGRHKFTSPCSYQEAAAEPLWGNPLIVDRHQCPVYYWSLAKARFFYCRRSIRNVSMEYRQHVILWFEMPSCRAGFTSLKTPVINTTAVST